MPRVMAVVLVLGLLVWGLAFLDFGKPRARRAGGAAGLDEPRAATPAPQVVARAPAAQPTRPAPAPAAAAATATPAPVARAPGPVPATRAEPYIALRPSPKQAAAQESPRQPANRGALTTATGELGEGINAPEYAEMERSYAHEPRDGAWAEGEERRLHDLLDRSPLASAVGLVNCQESMCRVLLESDDYDVYSRLLAIPGFRELTGLGPGSAYSHRSGQLSVYFPRRASDHSGR